MSSKSRPRVARFEDTAATCNEAARRFASICDEAVERCGVFRVALAGGSTPRLLHERLTQPPYRAAIAWEHIDFFWGDERCVPPDHRDSNYRMARETLLAPLGIASERIHRMPADAHDLDAAAREYEREISESFGLEAPGQLPRFDLILLGMGDDGHTASLFPRTPALDERERWVVANPVPDLDSARMTFTYPLIDNAAHVLFLVCGAAKAAALRDVIEGPSDSTRLPSQAVAPVDGELVFLVDGDAARLLDPATLQPAP